MQLSDIFSKRCLTQFSPQVLTLFLSEKGKKLTLTIFAAFYSCTEKHVKIAIIVNSYGYIPVKHMLLTCIVTQSQLMLPLPRCHISEPTHWLYPHPASDTGSTVPFD